MSNDKTVEPLRPIQCALTGGTDPSLFQQVYGRVMRTRIQDPFLVLDFANNDVSAAAVPSAPVPRAPHQQAPQAPVPAPVPAPVQPHAPTRPKPKTVPHSAGQLTGTFHPKINAAPGSWEEPTRSAREVELEDLIFQFYMQHDEVALRYKMESAKVLYRKGEEIFRARKKEKS